MWLTLEADRAADGAASPRVVTVHGEVDLATAGRLRDQLTELLHRHTPHLIVDLSGITFCDTAGLVALRGAARRAELLGGRLLLAAPSDRITMMLRITGQDRWPPAFPTVAEARAAAHAPLSDRTDGGTRRTGSAGSAGTVSTATVQRRCMHGNAPRAPGTYRG